HLKTLRSFSATMASTSFNFGSSGFSLLVPQTSWACRFRSAEPDWTRNEEAMNKTTPAKVIPPKGTRFFMSGKFCRRNRLTQILFAVAVHPHHGHGGSF